MNLLNLVFPDHTISSFCISASKGCSVSDPFLDDANELDRFLKCSYISGEQNFWYFHESHIKIWGFYDEELVELKMNPCLLELNNALICSSSSIFWTRDPCSTGTFYSTWTISSSSSTSIEVSKVFPCKIGACELSSLIVWDPVSPSPSMSLKYSLN